MIKLKLTHGLSHDNGYVRATWKKPYVEVEDEAVAQYCVDSGFFERVSGGAAQNAPDGAQTPTDGGNANGADDSATNANAATEGAQTPTDGNGGDELDDMTVSELKAYAETVGIDLGKLTKKQDIVNAIRKAEAE